MHRFGLVLAVAAVVAALAASGASAGNDTHVTATFGFPQFYPAGTICDFNYMDTFTATVKAEFPGTSFFIENWDVAVTHVNQDTGYTLTEVDHYVQKVDYDSGSLLTVSGLGWHLRDATGKIVFVQAGHVTYNPITGEIVNISGHLNPDFASVLCPLLGGAPA